MAAPRAGDLSQAPYASVCTQMAASTDEQPDGMTQVHAMAPSVFHHRGLRGRRTDVDTNANLGILPHM